jgi:Na+-transporting NADH:ubiquinone oxidoreductase subunit C
LAEPVAPPRPEENPGEGTLTTLLTVLLVSLVCSALVTTAVTVLRPIQERRAKIERERRYVLAAALLLGSGRPEAELAERVETHVVDLSSGTYADVDPATFDERRAASDPETSVEIPPDRDLADLGRRARRAPVYLVHREDGGLLCVVLPVYGEGLFSTLYGYLALEPDLQTVYNLYFYEQEETPGLGAEIASAGWQAGWRGKKVYGEDGAPRIRVAHGAARGPFEVDGITGATRTGNGVTGLVRYWLGPDGFGPYLERLRGELRGNAPVARARGTEEHG